MDWVEISQAIWNIISSKAGIAIITVILTSTLGFIFYGRKLKKKRRVEFEKVIGEQIATSLLKVREIEKLASIQEIYMVENRLNDKDDPINIFEDTIYPAIMEDGETFSSFMNKISKARDEHGKNFDREAAAFLWYGEYYIFQLLTFIAQNNLGEKMHIVGVVLFSDIQKWQRAFDNVLIKKLNKHKCKLVKQDGIIWEWRKNRILKKYYNKSVLYRLLEEPDGDVAFMTKTMIDNAEPDDKSNSKA